MQRTKLGMDDKVTPTGNWSLQRLNPPQGRVDREVKDSISCDMYAVDGKQPEWICSKGKGLQVTRSEEGQVARN